MATLPAWLAASSSSSSEALQSSTQSILPSAARANNHEPNLYELLLNSLRNFYDFDVRIWKGRKKSVGECPLKVGRTRVRLLEQI
jgi:hypothetical protein